MEWENYAKIIYKGTEWEERAVKSGRLMDNRLAGVEIGTPWGNVMNVHFDVEQYFAHFDHEVLVRRGVENKLKEVIKE